MIRAGTWNAVALATLHGACFPAAEAWPADAFADLLALPGHFAWLHADGLVLARSVAGEAELLTLGVCPGSRRRKLGSRLLAAAMNEAGRVGAEAMFLEVAAGNLAARRLYEAAGFVKVGDRRAYYREGSDALVLRARLTPCIPSIS